MPPPRSADEMAATRHWPSRGSSARQPLGRAGPGGGAALRGRQRLGLLRLGGPGRSGVRPPPIRAPLGEERERAGERGPRDGRREPSIDPRDEVRLREAPLVRIDEAGRPPGRGRDRVRPAREAERVGVGAHQRAVRHRRRPARAGPRPRGAAAGRGPGVSCAGEDLKPERHDVRERHSGRSPAEQIRHSYERARFCFERWAVLSDLPQPVVVAIQGYCLGAGVELASAGRPYDEPTDSSNHFPEAPFSPPVPFSLFLKITQY